MRLCLDLSVPLSAGLKLTAKVDSSAMFSVLSGPSGCGKSSLVKAVAGVETRAQGLIEFGSQRWLDSEQRSWVATYRRRVGWAPQEAHLFPQLSVAENLCFSRRTTSTGPSVHEVASMLELDGTLSRQPRHLSGGERQRVALGRALLSDPQLLLLDEPFSALDRPLRHRIIKRLHGFVRAQSIPTIVVSHEAQDLASVADVMWEIESGRLIETKASSLGGAPEARQNPEHGGPTRNDETNRH